MRNIGIRTVGSRSGPVNGGHVTVPDLPGITDFSDISGHTGRISHAECGQNRTNRVGQRRAGGAISCPDVCVFCDPLPGAQPEPTRRPTGIHVGRHLGPATGQFGPSAGATHPGRCGVGWAVAARPHSNAPSPAGARSSRVPDRCPARTLHVHPMCTRRSCRASSVRVSATAVVGRRSPGRAGHAGLAGTGGEERP
jgi:hypothetical protein